jgi:hypothetical protein
VYDFMFYQLKRNLIKNFKIFGFIEIQLIKKTSDIYCIYNDDLDPIHTDMISLPSQCRY